MIGWLAGKLFMWKANASVKKLQNSPKLFGAIARYRNDTIKDRIGWKIRGTLTPKDLSRACSMDPNIMPSIISSARYRQTKRKVGYEVKFRPDEIEEIRQDWDLFPLEDVLESGCLHSPDWKDGLERLKDLKPGSILAMEARDPAKKDKYLKELSKKWEKEFWCEFKKKNPGFDRMLFAGEPSYNYSYIFKCLTNTVGEEDKTQDNEETIEEVRKRMGDLADSEEIDNSSLISTQSQDSSQVKKEPPLDDNKNLKQEIKTEQQMEHLANLFDYSKKILRIIWKWIQNNPKLSIIIVIGYLAFISLLCLFALMYLSSLRFFG